MRERLSAEVILHTARFRSRLQRLGQSETDGEVEAFVPLPNETISKYRRRQTRRDREALDAGLWTYTGRSIRRVLKRHRAELAQQLRDYGPDQERDGFCRVLRTVRHVLLQHEQTYTAVSTSSASEVADNGATLRAAVNNSFASATKTVVEAVLTSARLLYCRRQLYEGLQENYVELHEKWAISIMTDTESSYPEKLTEALDEELFD